MNIFRLTIVKIPLMVIGAGMLGKFILWVWYSVDPDAFVVGLFKVFGSFGEVLMGALVASGTLLLVTLTRNEVKALKEEEGGGR